VSERDPDLREIDRAKDAIRQRVAERVLIGLRQAYRREVPGGDLEIGRGSEARLITEAVVDVVSSELADLRLRCNDLARRLDEYDRRREHGNELAEDPWDGESV